MGEQQVTLSYEVQASPIAKANMLRALNRMRAFYGLETHSSVGVASCSVPSSEPPADGIEVAASRPAETSCLLSRVKPGDIPWWAAASFDHNHLRLTRILRSLRLFGLEAEALALYGDLVVQARRGIVNRRSLSYWERALREPLFSSLQ